MREIVGWGAGVGGLTVNSSNDDDDGPEEKSGSSRSIAAPAATVYSCTTARHLTYVYI